MTGGDEWVLVTGAAGFIGAKVVQVLLEYGCGNIRCFVRPSSRLDRLQGILRSQQGSSRVEIVSGDLLSPEDCANAVAGVSVIHHLAASFDKSFENTFRNSVETTRNLLEAFAKVRQPRRFVHVSSFAVYSNFRMPRHAVLDEASPLEDSPRERHDAYAFGKLKQEEVVRELGRAHGLPFVVLRPGTVFGPGKRELTGRIGTWVGPVYLHVGGGNLLPLTYVDNCADAIVLAGMRLGIEGEVFNVVDDELLTSRQFLRAYRRRVGGFFCVPFPYVAAYGLCSVCEFCRKGSARVPATFNRRHCAAEWKGNRFSNRKLHDGLGWKPRVPMKDAMEAFLDQFTSDREQRTAPKKPG